MSETSKTIAFRVAPEIEAQIQAMAAAKGQSKGEWIRDRVMEALHGVPPETSLETKQPVVPDEASPLLGQAIEARIQATERVFRRGLKMVARDIEQLDKFQRPILGQLDRDVQGLFDRFDAASKEMLDAINRLHQSQVPQRDVLPPTAKQNLRRKPY